jgi:hypothetical protein
MKHKFDGSRRHLLRSVSLAVALAPLTGAIVGTAWATDLQQVSPDDPVAKALKYVPDFTKAPSDAKPGSKCENCKLYLGSAGAAQGGCPLFPGKAVKAGGWCISWTAKAT